MYTHHFLELVDRVRVLQHWSVLSVLLLLGYVVVCVAVAFASSSGGSCSHGSNNSSINNTRMELTTAS